MCADFAFVYVWREEIVIYSTISKFIVIRGVVLMTMKGRKFSVCACGSNRKMIE